MNVKTAHKVINLQEIALKLLANDEIANKITPTGIVFTAERLSKVIPQLKSLENTPLICLQKDKFDNNTYLLPTLYRDQSNFAVCLPNLNRSITTLFEVESWQIGHLSNAVFKTSGDIILKGGIAPTNNFLDDVTSEFRGQIEGQGTNTLKASWLKEIPQIELPLRILPIGVAFEVTGTGARSRKYSTPMVNLKDSSGNEYHNVITNSALRNLIDSGCQEFMIKEIITLTKDKTRTDKVLLTPLDGADFSDLLST